MTLLVVANKVVPNRGQKIRFYLPRCRVGKRTWLCKRMATLTVWVMVHCCMFDWASDINWASEQVTDLPWESEFHCHVYNSRLYCVLFWARWFHFIHLTVYFVQDDSNLHKQQLILSKMIQFCTPNSLIWARWLKFAQTTAYFEQDDSLCTPNSLIWQDDSIVYT
jgi:hypothetical protein